MQPLLHASGSHIAPPFTPYETRHRVTRHHEQAEVDSAGFPPLISSNPPSKRWLRGGKKGRTGDAGLGCMLRTGQWLLTTALIHLQLGQGK